MRRLFFLLTLFCLAGKLTAQNVYTIKADSVKITGCDSAELILENHTQGVKGFLFNKGNGRTEFRKGVIKLTDSIYLIGGDTLHMLPAIKTALIAGPGISIANSGAAISPVVIITAYVASANTVTLRAYNASNASVSMASQTYKVRVIK